MTSIYTVHLDKSSKKFICPSCSKKSFVRYVDTDTGSHLPEQFGKCDRVNNCNYHLHPKDSADYKTRRPERRNTAIISLNGLDLSFEYNEALISQIKGLKLRATFNNATKVWHVDYGNLASNIDEVDKFLSTNNFLVDNQLKRHSQDNTTIPDTDTGSGYYKFLLQFADNKQIDEVLKRYNTVLTDKYAIHGHRDTHGTITNHKYIEYQCNESGEPKRKSKSWYTNKGSYIGFFGEHLISKANEVHIVEGEKAAILGHLASGYTFVATGGANQWNKLNFRLLDGKTVYYYPDHDSAGDEAANKLKTILSDVVIIDLSKDYKRITGEAMPPGADIVDYLIVKKDAPTPEPDPQPEQPGTPETDFNTDIDTFLKWFINIPNLQYYPIPKGKRELYTKIINYCIDNLGVAIEINPEFTKFRKCETPF